jgi:type IV pilus assembly protein PilE
MSCFPIRRSPLKRGLGKDRGFTLIELMVTVTIVAILAAIAYPSYVNSITKTRRRAAEACLSQFATYMERFYTTNLRYDQDLSGTPMNTAALLQLNLDCASAQNTGQYYDYQLKTVSPSAYLLTANAKGAQASRDPSCRTLSLDQTGARTSSDGTNSTSSCW